ncbi:MAG TPA: ABC-type transport auxiliary lipoprotein family protein [Polyangiaceae bacterium]|nr:ABC-type transport auxiliary lipoprotein family protein [Polyangiaceae bacterium]
MSQLRCASVLAFFAGVALCGCALTSKADALSPRYFNPQATASNPPQRASQPYELRLGQISSASHLDERISYRVNAAEVGFYEDRRWTELPEAYLRRALEKQLFEQQGLTRVVTGMAPVLDVELTAFEELRQKPSKVRVTLTFSLRDERRSLLERTLDLEAPVDESSQLDAPESVAQTLANTLSRAVEAVGSEVVKRLAQTPPPVEPALPASSLPAN